MAGRAAARAEEDLAPYLAPPRCSYLFAPLAPAAARIAMWLLPELKVRTVASSCCIYLPALSQICQCCHLFPDQLFWQRIGMTHSSFSSD